MNVLAHIVGVNSFMKKEFLAELSKRDVYIKDLDEITSKLRKDKDLVKLDNMLTNLSRDQKQKVQSIKEKIKSFWIENLEKEIIHDLKTIDSKKKIVLLGFTNYHKNYRINIHINAPIKIFINTDPIKYGKGLIEYNLDKYRRQIIDNTFPLQYLNLEFLQQQREKLLEQYRKKEYLYKTEQITLKIFDLYMKKNRDVPDLSSCKLYMACIDKYDEKIPFGKINAYTEEWLALVSMEQNRDKIKKGFDILDNNRKPIPFVQELQKDGFKVFDVSCYLYELDTSSFKYIGNTYKFVSTEHAKIIRRTYVLHVKKKLKHKKVKFIRFHT